MRIRRTLTSKQGNLLPCFCFSSVGSTNAVAKSMVKSGEIDGKCVIIAKKQTSGRGRFDRTFVSPVGGVYLTYVTETHDLLRAPVIGMYSALAVCNVLERLGLVNSADAETPAVVTVKWPNDVRLYGKKVSGILSESVVIGDKTFVFIGIGLNVNTTEKQLGQFAKRATSVHVETGKKYSVAMVAEALALAEDALFERAAADHDAFHDEYLAVCNTVGKRLSYFMRGERVTGIAVAVSDDGALVVDREGTKDRLGWGEVTEIYE